MTFSHAREEDKTLLDREMKRLYYLGILERRFFLPTQAQSCLSALRTDKGHKRVVTDFKHLNIHIMKKILAYLLLKDTFALLGSSQCEVMSVLDLKDAFHSLRLMENSKKCCGILPYFEVLPTYIKESLWV